MVGDGGRAVAGSYLDCWDHSYFDDGFTVPVAAPRVALASLGCVGISTMVSLAIPLRWIRCLAEGVSTQARFEPRNYS